MPTCEKSPNGEHHNAFTDLERSNPVVAVYTCAYCGNKKSVERLVKERDKLSLPTDKDLDKE